MTSKKGTDFLERARSYLPGGWLGDLTLPDEMMLIASRGEGSRLYDVDGRGYLDFTMGGGSLILGHAHPAILEAVRRQMELGSTYYTLSDRSIELAEELVKAIPCAERVRFASTGGEATFYALRLARAFTGKEKILKFEGSYIGHSDYGMMSVSPPRPNLYPSHHPDSAGIPAAVQELVITAPFNNADIACGLVEEHAGELAAVIVEPVQRSIPPAPGFLEGLRQVTTERGVLLVYDEVVTGFRLAYGGAQEYFGVVPDLAAYGKAVACGFPLSAVAGRADVMELADPARKGEPEYVYISGTLSGNPVCAAAALATLEELSRPGVYDGLRGMGEQYRMELAALFDEHGVPARVQGIGPFFQVFFTQNPVTDYRAQTQADRKRFESFVRKMFARGIFMSRRAKNYLSTAHGESDLAEFLEAARAVCAGGID
ncbi:MAG: aspartate aminotransferase family protein [Nitrospinae bacterium]|nr:aspartate aminotransferase family protein [Nitrospinota bacterium]